MSMLDSFFRQGFKGPKCKTLLKLTIPRIKLLRNRREIQIKQMRRDIAKLLETGQEATARIRVEHIIREENMMAAQEILELFCELISVRIPIIETQRECPLDLKEAISTVCFAAPRCADLPELMHVQMLFASKYGKEFVAAASELRPDCGVNRQIIELLSVRAPAPERKMKLLTEIAEEHGLDWDPTSSETEMLKQPEDLLNGPSQFVSGSMLPLPKEKHEETLKSIPSQGLNEQHGADSDSDELDFPEVPKVSVRPNLNPVPPAIPAVSVTDNESTEEEVDESTPHQSDSDPKQEETTQMDPGTKTYEVPNEVKTGNTEQYQAYTTPVISPSAFSAQSSTTFPSLSKRRSDVNVDLQDVLAAAQAAAESAERAASAARSAASLAQMRISQLIRKNNEEESESIAGLSPHEEVADELITAGKGNFNLQQTFSNSSVTYSPWTDKDHWEHPKLDSNNLPDHAMELKFDSYGSFGNGFQPDLTREQPHRSTSSMEDDPFSYPDLFSSKKDYDEPGDHSLNTKSSFS